jgi:hypothetical protein
MSDEKVGQSGAAPPTWKVGDRVRFRSVSETSARWMEIEQISPNGTLKLCGLSGWFAPGLFVGQKQSAR